MKKNVCAGVLAALIVIGGSLALASGPPKLDPGLEPYRPTSSPAEPTLQETPSAAIITVASMVMRMRYWTEAAGDVSWCRSTKPALSPGLVRSAAAPTMPKTPVDESAQAPVVTRESS